VSHFIYFNGAFLPSGEAILSADNPGFRYGDGLFETMRAMNGRLILGDLHFERLLAGLRLLQFIPTPSLTAEKFSVAIRELCEKNGHSGYARVRLVVFRGDEEGRPETIIQSAPLEAWGNPEEAPQQGQGEGLVIDLFPGGRKSCDVFSHLKSNNYLLYSMAARYARQEGLGDCLVLNSNGRVADSSISNVFYCRDGRIYTPPLSEGCVAGVMRRFVISLAIGAGLPVEEKETTPEDLEEAEEVFLTNAIRGIRPVGRFRRTVYPGGEMTLALHRLLRETLMEQAPKI